MMQPNERDYPSQAHTTETLEPVHYRDLLAIRRNQRFLISPSRRDMFRRLGLIKPAEPPRKPGMKLRAPSPRQHVLTDTGNAVLDQWIAEGGR